MDQRFLDFRYYTVMRRITTFRSTTYRIYDRGPIIVLYYITLITLYYIMLCYIILYYVILYYIILYYIITLTTVLQLPTVFSTVTYCTGL